MTRNAKPLNSQMNLLLVDSLKTVVPEGKQRELAQALVELLIGAVQESSPESANGGGDELETDR